ncbi:MAG: hypothetical protein AB7V77_00415 [Candidatus Woesearchaeota archaeon]
MHPTEFKIIQLLGKETKELNTTELISEIFKNEFKKVNEDLKSYEKVIVQEAKRTKAQMHRKILYHLNKLTKENYIYVVSTHGKGEKLFKINEEKRLENTKDDEIKTILDNLNKNKDTFPLGLEGYEEEGIIRIHGETDWSNKINAIFLKPILDINKFMNLLHNIYSYINDCIGILNFQEYIETKNEDETKNFLKKINLDSTDYGKRISIQINLERKVNFNKMLEFIKLFSELKPKNIECVFQITKESLKENLKLFKEITQIFCKEKIRINIQNSHVHEAPIIVGLTGTYSLCKKDWDSYNKIQDKVIGVCVSDTVIGMDVEKIYNLPKSFVTMKEIFSKISKALLLASSNHRKKSDSLFKKINDYNKPYENYFFSVSSNYIRLWNYDPDREDYNMFVSSLQDIEQYLDDFSKTEETIFKSCGIPIRFKISLSSAFGKFGEKMSKRKYEKITIKNKEDLTSEKTKNYIEKRKQLFDLFMCDRIRFFRNEDYNTTKITDEFFTIMDNYRLPFFSYDFKPRQGNLTLNTFFK